MLLLIYVNRLVISELFLFLSLLLNNIIFTAFVVLPTPFLGIGGGVGINPIPLQSYYVKMGGVTMDKGETFHIWEGVNVYNVF